MNHDSVTRFQHDGYLLLRGFLDATAVAELRAAIESAPERTPGENPLSLATMRFASNLFYASEPLQRFLASPAVVDVVTTLLGPDAWARWDQAVWKGPDAPTFPWHQDNGYTELPTMHLQLWVALTHMNPDNGGLLLAPGGHRRPAAHRLVGNHVEMDDPDVVAAVDAAAGDVIVFSSYLPHATTPNSTGTDRLAYVAEFLPLEAPDRSVEAPHFVVARGGRPAPAFVDLSVGWPTP